MKNDAPTIRTQPSRLGDRGGLGCGCGLGCGGGVGGGGGGCLTGGQSFLMISRGIRSRVGRINKVRPVLHNLRFPMSLRVSSSRKLTCPEQQTFQGSRSIVVVPMFPKPLIIVGQSVPGHMQLYQQHQFPVQTDRDRVSDQYRYDQAKRRRNPVCKIAERGQGSARRKYERQGGNGLLSLGASGSQVGEVEGAHLCFVQFFPNHGFLTFRRHRHDYSRFDLGSRRRNAIMHACKPSGG